MSLLERRVSALEGGDAEPDSELAHRRLRVLESPSALAAALAPDGYIPDAPHLLLIQDAFMRLIDGRNTKVNLAMPPRHGKSEFLRWCLLWHLATFPDEGIMIVSNASELALKHGRWLRRMIEAHGELLGIQLSTDSKASNRFDIRGRAGGAVITTPGGGGTGFTARTILVDDPVKSRKHANSKGDMAALEDWWRDVVVSRRMPGWGGALLMHTRFGEMDLAGRLLAQDPEAWYVLNVPAVAMTQEEFKQLGVEPVPDALGRQPGEALWPEVYPLEVLDDKRRDSGESAWWALYQGQPRRPEGALLKPEDITAATVALVPDGRCVVAVDPAGEGDDEVGVITAVKGADGVVYLSRDDSGSMGSALWPEVVCRAALDSGAGTIVAEANGVGQAAPRLIRLAWQDGQREGWIPPGRLVPNIEHKGTSESKWMRAEPVAALIRNGGVKFGPGLARCAHEFLTWTPDSGYSPGRLDAAVWAVTELNPLRPASRVGNPARPPQPKPVAAAVEGVSVRPSPWGQRVGK